MDLTFATKGQAEALAAQEAVAKKAREGRQEFEAGAKAAKTWDENVAKMARTSESALRSVQTEQEKIVAQIDAIQQAVGKGLYAGREKEAEQGIARLKQQWIDVDTATIKAKEEGEAYASGQAKIKAAAEAALGSVETELERIAQQIGAIEAAADAGLVPPDEAEEGVRRLRERYDEVKQSTIEVKDETSKLHQVIFKAFDPLQIAKWGLGFVGVKAIISGIREEIDDLQTAVDKRNAAFMSPKERADELAKNVKAAQAEADRDAQNLADRDADLKRTQTRAGEAEGERRAQIEERIGDQELELSRARADREESVQKAQESRTKAEEKYAEQLTDARLQFTRAQEDFYGARTPSARKGAERRMDDARTRVFRLQSEINADTDDSSLKNSDRRIADLERELARLRADLAKPGGGEATANAQLARDEAAREAADSRQKLAAAEAEQKNFESTPEFQRYQAVDARGKAVEEAFHGLASMADASQLSSEELEKFADLFRELGYGPMSQKLKNFADRLDDGTVSVDEVIADLKNITQEISDRATDRIVSGGGGEFDSGMKIPGRPLTTEERGQVYYIEQLIAKLDAADVKADAARQRQIQLLEQLLDNGGIPVGGE